MGTTRQRAGRGQQAGVAFAKQAARRGSPSPPSAVQAAQLLQQPQEVVGRHVGVARSHLIRE